LWSLLSSSVVYGAEQNLYDLDDCPVQELHPDSYQKILDREKMTIIVFYAPVLLSLCLSSLNLSSVVWALPALCSRVYQSSKISW
jgi:hypothetical protein